MFQFEENGAGKFLNIIEATFHSIRESLVRYIGLMMSLGLGMAETKSKNLT